MDVGNAISLGSPFCTSRFKFAWQGVEIEGRGQFTEYQPGRSPFFSANSENVDDESVLALTTKWTGQFASIGKEKGPDGWLVHELDNSGATIDVYFIKEFINARDRSLVDNNILVFILTKP